MENCDENLVKKKKKKNPSTVNPIRHIDMHCDVSAISQFTEQSWKVGFPNINAFFHSGMFVYTYFLYKR